MSAWSRVGRVVAAVAIALSLGSCASPTPPPHGITAFQRSQATQANLYMLWAQVSSGNPEFVPPKVKIVRYTNYLDNPTVIASCLRRGVYPATKLTATQKIIDPTLTPQQAFAFTVAKYVCEAKYPIDPLELGYLSDAQEEYLYNYWENETVPCLRGQGQMVKDLKPVGAFGEGYEDVALLNPYLHLPAHSPTARLMSSCPPYPGEIYGAPASRQ